MTRIFEPDPTRNPLAEAMAKLDEQETVKRTEALHKIGMAMGSIVGHWIAGTDMENLPGKLKQLHEQIGNWLEGNYGK